MTVQITDITEGPVFALGPDPNRTVYPTGIASAEAVGTTQLNASIALSGIAGAATVGTVQVGTFMIPTGIAGGEAFGAVTMFGDINVLPDGVAAGGGIGTPALEAEMSPAGLPSSASVGTAYAFNSIFPQGIAAGSGAVGTPSTTAAMQPTGLASGVQFGDADTVATVFIIPGPVDPSNDFGTVNVIRKGWLFRPPVNTYQWRLFKEYEGISLLKEDGVWSEVAHPDLERTRTAQIYLGGGRDHFVDDATKAELISEGYTVTEEIIP